MSPYHLDHFNYIERRAGQEQLFSRAELAQQAGVDRLIVDLIVEAGLLTPLDNSNLPLDERRSGSDSSVASSPNVSVAAVSPASNAADANTDERFGLSALDMLKAVQTFISEGVAVEEIAALAIRHAANVEAVIDDALDLFKHHATRHDKTRSELMSLVQRLVPVATVLITNHFESALNAKVQARIDDTPKTSGDVVVCKRLLDRRVDPLAVYLHADPDEACNLWLCSSSELGIATLGAVETIQPCGSERFSIASAARAMLEGRVRCYGPDNAPSSVLVGGFSFVPLNLQGYDCRLVMGKLTVIDRHDGTWVLAASQVKQGETENAIQMRLEQRIDAFVAQQTKNILDDACDVSNLAATIDVSTDAGASADVDSGIAAASDIGMNVNKDDDYIRLVSEGVERINQDEFQKVVLARHITLDIDISSPSSMACLLARLQRRNPGCVIFAFALGDHTFFGATPEELVTFNGSKLHTTALAGTAVRGETPDEDDQLAKELFTSAKNRSEHSFVVEGLTEALANLGLTGSAPDEPELLKLAHIQHLRTPVTAQAQHRRTRMSDMDVIRIAGVLHPTPAVGGTPTEAALQFIADKENFDRGWYAAPIGWCDLQGNGELRVALRSGLAGKGWVKLFAGAGVVADSIPQSELHETSIKFSAVLDSLLCCP